MAEKLLLTPNEGRITLFNEIFTYPGYERGHYSEEVARALHRNWEEWYLPNSQERPLTPKDITGLQEQILADRIEATLNKVDPRERQGLTWRFSLDGQGIRTLHEIGDEFRVTRERARQIVSKGVRRLHFPSNNRLLREFLRKS